MKSKIFPTLGPVLSTEEIRQFFLRRRRLFDVTGQETEAARDRKCPVALVSLNGIIHANIIRRAFTVHLMFHERVEWILHGRAIPVYACTRNFQGRGACRIGLT